MPRKVSSGKGRKSAPRSRHKVMARATKPPKPSAYGKGTK